MNNPIDSITGLLPTWKVEMPYVAGINQQALLIGQYRYYTLVSPTGVKVALSTTDLYLHNNRVWLADPIEVDEHRITIPGIVCPSTTRGQGYTAVAMKQLLWAIDSLKIVVKLEPIKMNGYGKGCMNDIQLRKWYGRLGFVGDAIMIRKPK